jgi:hypothetical protein
MKKKIRVTKLKMIQELTPLIEGLEAEGNKNMATMVPATVAYLAGKLRRLIEGWQRERPPTRGKRKRSKPNRPAKDSNQCLGL